MSYARLFINRFMAFKSGAAVYDQKFHKGVNIIRGANGTGKSTIADLITYAIGSVITDWTTEQRCLDFVVCEVEINGLIYSLRREIRETGQAEMYIYEGPLSNGLESVDGWLKYSYRRSDERHSFSQKLFELMGLPRNKTDDDKNLTMHQILRLMYVDQLSAPTKLLKEERSFDNAIYRRAIGEYLLGIDDLEAHNLRQDLISHTKTYERFESELSAISKVFSQDNLELNEDSVEQKIAAFRDKIDSLEKEKEKVIASQVDSLDEKRKEFINSLRGQIDICQIKLKEYESKRLEINTELVDTELFLQSLEARKLHLEQSKTAHDALGTVTFKYCPSCLSPIEQCVGDSGCSLCKTESSQERRQYSYIRMLNEINFQVSESRKLVDRFRDDLENLNIAISTLKSGLEELFITLQSNVSALTSRDILLGNISQSIGKCLGDISSLQEKKQFLSRVHMLREEKKKAQEEINKIKDKLDKIRDRQANRFTEVYNKIESKAIELLKCDEGYEESFKDPESVSFDFARDRMAVNERTKFSASSMVIMKNSIRLSIFLCSVKDRLSRMPNLMIMDNIEDKGMVDVRSQAFQHLIVRECSKLENDYQLIFTTSMIASDLNSSPLCVGPMYQKGEHTLAL
ncbi:AAA family ATPase [Ferrimonas balearica]|uniref:AAA family ATPase n=1 Tax=Ferrimonas balearica TaxID=44012 RepID=UPI001C58E375|nr:AAA family ATPase [Ferrimonas balearica]MBW3139510.1 AAA family ATPase [Ferrimonas balearica]